MGITEFLVQHITHFIDTIGYLSVFVLMVMESMVLPVPSEAVMPFAGFLIAEKSFTFLGVIFYSTLGSIVGSLISYYIGRYAGKPFVNRYGRYLLLSQRDLRATEHFFATHGEITILISRFIPVIRHLISLPAGVGKMKILKFALYTVVGACLWNTFLATVGVYLKQNWERVVKYSSILDIVVIILIISVIILFIYRHTKRRNERAS
jgi:membrane protein DedA with SNARE-associated domain